MIPPHCRDWERRRREELGLDLRVPYALKDFKDDGFELYWRGCFGGGCCVVVAPDLGGLLHSGSEQVPE